MSSRLLSFVSRVACWSLLFGSFAGIMLAQDSGPAGDGGPGGAGGGGGVGSGVTSGFSSDSNAYDLSAQPGQTVYLGTTNSGPLATNGANAYFQTGSIVGTGTLVLDFSLSRLLFLGGTNAFSGPVYVNGLVAADGNFGGTGNTLMLNGGVLMLGLDPLGTYSTASTVALSNPLTVTSSGGTISLDAGNTLTLAGQISGTGAWSKTGGGLLVLSNAANTYSGALTLAAGTVRTDASGALSASAAHAINGSLDLNGFNQTTGNLSGSGTISLGGATLTVGQSADDTFSGAISGSGTLVKNGAATLTLSGTNTYSGPTTIAAGTLQLGAGGASGSIAGDIVDNGALVINRSDTLTLTNVISGTGTLTQAGAGTTILAGTNSYSGGTTVAAGALQIDADSRLGSGALALNGGALRYGAAFDDLRGFTLGAGGGTVDTNGFDVTHAQSISGVGGFTKTGAGTLTLTGANTYTGGTTVAAGTLLIGAAGALPDNASITLNGGTLDLGGHALTTAALSGTGGNLVLGATTLTLNQATDTTFAGAIAGGGSVVKTGGGTLTFSGANTYTGGTLLSGGTLQLGNGGTSGSLSGDVTVGAGATLAFNRSDAVTFMGNLSGAGNLLKSGAGNLTLTGANSVTGTTTIAAGSLQLGNGGTSGSLAGGIVDNGALVLNRSDTLIFGNGISGTGTLTQAGAGTTVLGGTNTYSGGTTVTGGVLQVDADSRLGTGALTLDGGTLRFGAAFSDLRATTLGTSGGGFDTNGHDGAVASVISGAGGLTKTGAGTLTLGGANTYVGGTTVASGTLALGSAGALGTGGSMTVAAGATLDLAGYAQSFSSLSGAGVTAFGGAAVTVGANDASATYSGVLTGTGSLTKVGAGTLSLTGANTFSGPTTVSGGVLQINSDGALGTGALTLDGGTLRYGTAFDTLRAFGGGGNGATLDTNGFDVTYVHDLPASGSFTKAGAGTLVLTNAVPFIGINVVGGTLQVPSFANDGPAPLFTLNGGTLRLGSDGLALGSLTIAGTGGSIDTNGFNATIGDAEITVSSGALTKSGAGILTLTHPFPAAVYANGFAPYQTDFRVTGGALGVDTNFELGLGTLTLDGGALQFTAAFNDLRVIALGSTGGTLDTNGFDVTYANAISGPGGFTKAGGGNLTLTGSIAAASTTVAGGTLQIDADTHLGSGGLTLNGGNLRYGAAFNDLRAVTLGANGGGFDTNGFDVTYGNVLSGAGAFTKTGAGTLTLAAANTFSGATTVAAGTLALGNSLALQNSTLNDTSAGGTVDFGSLASVTLGGLAGDKDIALGAVNVTIGGNNSSTAYSGALSTAGSLTKTGTGILALAGANTIAGGTTIAAGTLQLGNGGTSGTLGGAVSVAAGATLAYDRSDDFVSSLTVSGAGGMTKLGAGNLIVTGSNTYTGTTEIVAGTLTPGSGSFPNGMGPADVGASGTLVGSGLVVASLTGAGTVNVAGATNFYVDNIGTDTFSGTIGGLGALVKRQAGTLILAGTNTFAGGTTVTAGALQIGAGGTSGSVAGDIAIASGTTVTFNRADAITFGGGVSGDGGLIQSGPGTLVLTGVNTQTGGTTIADGTLQLGNGGTTGSLTGDISDNAALAFNRSDDVTFANRIAGSGSVTKAGVGMLTLTGANTYAGGTTIAGGVLSVAGDNNLGAADGSVTFNGGTLQAAATFTAARATTLALGGGTFDVATGQTLTWNGAITGGVGNPLTKLGAGTLLLGGVNTYSGDTNVNAGTLRLAAAGALSPNSKLFVAPGATFDANGFAPALSQLTGAGAIDVGSEGIEVTPSGSSTFGGTLGGSGGFTMNGSGTLELDHANTYDGSTALANGTLKLGADGALPTNTPVTLGAGATLDLNGHDATLGSLSGSGTVTTGGATLTVTQNSDTTFSGVLSGTGGLQKSGSGRLTLTGASTFSGPTSITGGEIKLNGSAANSAFTLSGGGLLSGNATVGALTIGSGGILSPGNSPGMTNAGNTAWVGGGAFQWQINSTAGTAGHDPGWDLLNISGSLAITATSGNRFSIDLMSLTLANAGGTVGDFNANANGSFTLVTTTGGITGFNANDFTLDTSQFQNALNGTWSISQSGNDLTLDYTTSAVPEPSAYAACAGAAALALAAWRKRKRTRAI